MRPARAGWRRQARRWAEGFDPWAPRAGDYLVASLLLLLLALAYVGERSYAVQLSRRILELEERREGLRTEVEMLSAEATSLADRGRVVELAEERLGLVFPDADDVAYIYYVSPSARERAGAGRRSGRR